jgi:6-phosphogluconolactonase
MRYIRLQIFNRNSGAVVAFLAMIASLRRKGELPMPSNQITTLPNPISRRTFVQGAGAATIIANTTMAKAFDFGRPGSFAYLGTYTAGSGNGQGIYLYQANPFTGELELVKLVSNVPDPSFLCASASGKFLYATNEISNFNGGTTGSVTSFSVNTSTGDLTLLNTVSSVGGGPVFLSIDATGKYLFVANYGGGSIAVLPIHTDGSLGTAVDSHVDIGNVGPTTATNAPPGSFAFSGHDAPHAHCILPDNNSKFILQTDLGQDRIYVYSFDPNTGVLTPADTPFVSIPPGDGPRHIFFHPNGRWLYLITEEASTLMVFSYNNSNGALTEVQLISALPPGFKGSSFGSEVRVSADGRFVYAANRLHDSIAVFEINYNGELKFIGEAATRGDYPRQFIIDPTGSFLYSCNQRSDNLTSYRIDRVSGLLKFTGQYVAAGSPSCIIFLPQGRI